MPTRERRNAQESDGVKFRVLNFNKGGAGIG